MIDTSAIQHLVRLPRAIRRSNTSNKLFSRETIVDKFAREQNITVVVDFNRSLCDEWIKTCGEELVKGLIVRWSEWGSLQLVKEKSTLGQGVGLALKRLGFDDAYDKLVLRIAIVTKDRIVVAEDPDFWKPGVPQMRGDPNAPVAKLCWDKLGIKNILLGQIAATIPMQG